MKTLLVPMLAVVSLASCATNRMSDTDRLALYEAHAGEPVKQVRYTSTQGCDRVGAVGAAGDAAGARDQRDGAQARVRGVHGAGGDQPAGVNPAAFVLTPHQLSSRAQRGISRARLRSRDPSLRSG